MGSLPVLAEGFAVVADNDHDGVFEPAGQRSQQTPDLLIDKGHFSEILDDPTPPAKQTRRLLMCSGKVFYDLIEGREEAGVEDVAILRIEQFYPFNAELFRSLVEPHLGAKQMVWVQEETQNRGGWGYMLQRMMEMYPRRRLRYVGREPSASPATGSPRIHREQQAALVAEALHG